METSGSGKLAVSGFGSLSLLEVKDGREIIIDNSHAVAWDTRLHYELSTTTAKSGFLSGLVNSAKSGEGLVLKFRGAGNVVVCSRNRPGFLAWVAAGLKAAS